MNETMTPCKFPFQSEKNEKEELNNVILGVNRLA